MTNGFLLTQKDSIWKCSFQAMASPCEILISTDSFDLADTFSQFAYSETKRIEAKFSRYLTGNIIYKINNSKCSAVRVDEETARLLDFAGLLWNISEGLFDITSGVLRQCWKFDTNEVSPDLENINTLLTLVGWEKVRWDGSSIILIDGMEIDFGGIGKEYAVDIIAEGAKRFDISRVMVNFGGDIRAISNDTNSPPWVIGIEESGKADKARGAIELLNGGIATSGDSKRYAMYQGKRLGHILNPKTGWPIVNAPHSVTVIADNCTQAGMLATLSMLKGKDAETFLEEQGVKYFCQR